MGLKSLAKLFSFAVCNPCQSSPSLTILVPLWFISISLVFFHLCKALFSNRKYAAKVGQDNVNIGVVTIFRLAKNQPSSGLLNG